MKKKLLDISLPEQQNQDNETCSLIRMGTFFHRLIGNKATPVSVFSYLKCNDYERENNKPRIYTSIKFIFCSRIYEFQHE